MVAMHHVSASPVPPVPLSAAAVCEIVDKLRHQHETRQALIRASIRLTNQIKALLRDRLEEDERTRRGTREVEAVYVVDPETGRRKSPYAKYATDRLRELIGERLGWANLQALEAADSALTAASTLVDAQADKIKHEMEKDARTLPVWPWVERVRGFGAIGLAQIVAETSIHDGRHLSHYATPAKVWKRMGLAVLSDGTRQRRVAGLNEQETLAIGYNPERRAIMFVIGDSLLKGNQDGPYRTAYVARKAYEDARLPEDLRGRKMTAHLRAQRYMEKRLLRDLWRAWRALTPCEDAMPSETEAWAE